MIKFSKEAIARKTWINAAKVFSFDIITPFNINVEGTTKEIFAYLPRFGAKNGTLVCLIYSPDYKIDRKLLEWSQNNNYLCSFVNIDDFQKFELDYFDEVLNDWKIYNQ